MWALIAFIVMAALILTLIEINERRKAKRLKAEQSKEESQKTQDDCPPEKAEQGDCSGCGLIEVCEKEEKKTSR